MAKQKKKNSTKSKNKFITPDAQYSFLGLLLFVLTLIGLGKYGPIGNLIVYALAYLTGVLHVFILLFFLVLGLFLFLRRKLPAVSLGLYSTTALVLFLFLMIYASDKASGITSAIRDFNGYFNYVSTKRFVLKDTSAISSLGGGIIGFILFGLLASIFTKMGAQIFSLIFIIGCLFILARPLAIKGYKRFQKLKTKFPEIRLKFGNHKEKPKNEVVNSSLEKIDTDKELGQKIPVRFDVFNEQVVGEGQGTVSVESGKKAFSYDIFSEPLVKTATIATVIEKEILNQPIEAPIIPTAKDSLYINKTINVPNVVNGDRKKEQDIPKAPSNDLKNYHLPPLGILKEPSRPIDAEKSYEEAINKVNILNSKFGEFKIRAEVENFTIGPSVTRFEIRPDSGVRVNTIANVQDDIMLATAAKSIRIEAPIPGKSVVGIEIPNRNRSIVAFKEVLSSIPANNPEKLQVVVGKDIDGLPVTIKLNKMPHLLVAGATGSGKSVCMNAIIASILMRALPSEVKLLLIDPKKVEMAVYTNIPHLICPVISDPKEAALGLKKVVEEMEYRYNAFADCGQRNIEGYNTYAEKEGLAKLPYIVVIIDELADLMNVASKEVESYIQRITQLARAAGIHLIVATQRPSVNIITGVIKANIPSRIAFAVSNGYDSKTILDSTGAEQLLGMGDMLLSISGEINIRRVQGAFVSDDEINEIVKFIKNQSGPLFDDKFLQLEEPPMEINIPKDSDSVNEETLYQDIRQFVIDQQRATTSSLQRYFNIGYGRAARILDLLEAEGIVGPQQGTKPREVLVKKGEQK